MASRLTVLFKARLAAVVWSATASLLCGLLYWQWRNFEVAQARFLTFYSDAAGVFSAEELDHLAPPSSAHLVLFAVVTGMAISLALTLWRQGAR